MIYSISNIWILQKQLRYKDLTIMLPRWYLLGYRPNSAQISNITSVWNKRKLNIKFKRPMKACFFAMLLSQSVSKPTSLCIFNDLNWVSSSRAYIITSTKTLLFLKLINMIIKSFQSHTAVRIYDVLTSLLVVVLGLHLSNQVARHHVGLVVLPLMIPV